MNVCLFRQELALGRQPVVEIAAWRRPAVAGSLVCPLLDVLVRHTSRDWSGRFARCLRRLVSHFILRSRRAQRTCHSTRALSQEATPAGAAAGDRFQAGQPVRRRKCHMVRRGSMAIGRPLALCPDDYTAEGVEIGGRPNLFASTGVCTVRPDGRPQRCLRSRRVGARQADSKDTPS